MPWKERRTMSLKIEFVERAAAGEKIAPLCREFGVSRTAGHKWFKRYKEQGCAGLKKRAGVRVLHRWPRPRSWCSRRCKCAKRIRAGALASCTFCCGGASETRRQKCARLHAFSSEPTRSASVASEARSVSSSKRRRSSPPMTCPRIAPCARGYRPGARAIATLHTRMH